MTIAPASLITQCRIPTPFWFVAYYKKWHGNPIRASWYLEKEIGLLPTGHKKIWEGCINQSQTSDTGNDAPQPPLPF